MTPTRHALRNSARPIAMIVRVQYHQLVYVLYLFGYLNSIRVHLSLAPEVAMVYSLTQMRVVVTTFRIFVGNECANS